MQKLIFTLMMMAGLALVAVPAMGQGTYNNPWAGQTYSYSLNQVTVQSSSLVEVTYTGSNVTLPADQTIATGTDITVIFDVTYLANATDGKLRVTITDEDGLGCPNFIEIAVTVAQPEFTFNITPGTFTCQNLGTPGDNEDAATATSGTPPSDNTFTYTITPSIDPGSFSGSYTYDIDLDFNDIDLGATVLVPSITSGNGTLGDAGDVDDLTYAITAADGEIEITMTFTTTSGEPNTDFTASISNAVVDITAGAQNETGLIGTNPATVTVTSLPAINGTIQ